MPSPYLFPSEELFMREGVVVPSDQAEMLTNTCTQRRTVFLLFSFFHTLEKYVFEKLIFNMPGLRVEKLVLP